MLGRIGIGAVAALLALAPVAEAATRIGDTNEFAFGNMGLTFSLSLTPSAGAVTTYDLPSWNAGVSAGNAIPNAFLPVAGNYVVNYMIAGQRNAPAISGVAGTSPSQGVLDTLYGPYEGSYFTVGGQGAVAVASFMTGSGGSYHSVEVKFAEVLWGDPNAGDRLHFSGSDLYGSEVQEAAAALGIWGAPSYYVSVNSTDPRRNGFGSIYGWSGGQSLNFATVAFSPVNDFSARDASLAGPSAGPSAAPAPLPALGGTLPGVLAAVAGFGAWRRRRAA